jgi:hypothetical protein
MQTFKLAAVPALFLVFWIVASVHTISELSTVAPALGSAQVSTGPEVTPGSRPERAFGPQVTLARQRRVAARGGSR